VKVADAVPAFKAIGAVVEAPLTMNCTVPVGLLPVTVAVAVKEVPKVMLLGTPLSTVVVLGSVPAFTVTSYGPAIE
jgi:hypothetical protein